jgi:ribonuclease Z
MKAICVLEAVVRKQDTDPYSIVASYFSENSASVVRCCELPQVSLREKASKVSQHAKLTLLKSKLVFH